MSFYLGVAIACSPPPGECLSIARTGKFKSTIYSGPRKFHVKLKAAAQSRTQFLKTRNIICTLSPGGFYIIGGGGGVNYI